MATVTLSTTLAGVVGFSASCVDCGAEPIEHYLEGETSFSSLDAQVASPIVTGDHSCVWSASLGPVAIGVDYEYVCPGEVFASVNVLVVARLFCEPRGDAAQWRIGWQFHLRLPAGFGTRIVEVVYKADGLNPDDPCCPYVGTYSFLRVDAPDGGYGECASSGLGPSLWGLVVGSASLSVV